MKQLVIFDLDGTLLNTYMDITAATNHALALHGYPTHDMPTIRSFIGNGINKLFERALPEGHKSESDVLKIREAFIPYYNQHGADFTMPFPGIVELLYTLQRLGVKLAVASNKYQQATSQLIATYFPEIDFTAVLGQRDGVAVKPDPAIVNDIIMQAGTAREDVLYIGDSGVDMQTAAAAGVTAIGVTWGCRTREALAQYSPHAIIDSAEEVLGYL